MTPRRTGRPPSHQLVMALRALDAIPDGPRFLSYDPDSQRYRIAAHPHPSAVVHDLTAEQATGYLTAARDLHPDAFHPHNPEDTP